MYKLELNYNYSIMTISSKIIVGVVKINNNILQSHCLLAVLQYYGAEGSKCKTDLRNAIRARKGQDGAIHEYLQVSNIHSFKEKDQRWQQIANCPPFFRDTGMTERRRK